jgi:putative membrane protein
MSSHPPESRTPAVLLAALAILLIWSLIGCHDRFTWFLEVVPALIAVPFLVYSYPRLRFTNLVYLLIAAHAAILMIGGHHTYAEVPLFNWLKDAYHLSRNYYDRIGHFAQGFVPALIVREVLLRFTPLKKGRLLIVLVIGVCMGISAFYELVEFAAAQATGSAADAFLGLQGDPWDTQWDMTYCLIGAVTALLLLSAPHDRALSRVPRNRLI